MRPFIVMTAVVALALPACNCGGAPPDPFCDAGALPRCYGGNGWLYDGTPVYETCEVNLFNGYEGDFSHPYWWMPARCSSSSDCPTGTGHTLVCVGNGTGGVYCACK